MGVVCFLDQIRHEVERKLRMVWNNVCGSPDFLDEESFVGCSKVIHLLAVGRNLVSSRTPLLTSLPLCLSISCTAVGETLHEIVL